MSKQVTKAVIPAAGFGTRMLPFTKAVPKELIPLVDTPVLQYVVEEAVASGANEILVVISEGKDAVKNHFSPAEDLEKRLHDSGKELLLESMQKINTLADIRYVYQSELNGLGGAVALAGEFVGNDPFFVLLGDTVMDSADALPVSGQLAVLYEKYGDPVVALAEVPLEKVSSYGIASGSEIAQGVWLLDDLVEKPDVASAPSCMAVSARYLLTPDIFPELGRIKPGKNNEIQLTDAIRELLQTRPFYGCQVKGKRYDLGSVSGFIAANVEFAMRRPELQEVLGRQILDILKEKNIL